MVNAPPVTSNVSAPAFIPGSARNAIPSLVGSDDGSVSFYKILTLPDPNDGVLYINNVIVTELSQVDSLTSAQISQLSFQPLTTFDGAIFTYTATDNLGVIDVTPAVYTIPYNFSAALPVQILSFTGSKYGNNNVLNWATSQESGLSHFEVEYSSDGKTFMTIAKVSANGNTLFRSDYTYSDPNGVKGVSYYRLRLVDKDAHYKYSNVVAIKREAGIFVSNVYPNPFTDKIYVELQLDNEQKVEFNLYDGNGKVVNSKTIMAQKGLSTFQFNYLGSLPKGMYVIEARSSAGLMTTKLIK